MIFFLINIIISYHILIKFKGKIVFKVYIYIYIYIYIYMYVCMYIYNTVCILYLHRLVHLIFLIEEEEVLFIYSFPLIYGLSNRWREKVMDKIHLDCWG